MSSKKNLKIQIIGGVIIIIIFFIFLVSRSAKTVPTAEQATSTTTPTIEAKVTTEQVKSYEVLKKDEQKTVTNYSILVTPGTDGKMVANDVKKSCTKPCNISIYDDQQAYFKYLEYDLMMGNLNTPQEKLTAWKKNNYVFVADHLIGDVTFDTGEYNDYPFRDWYYKELKGEK